jgi:HEAT repeat protein
LVDCLSAKNEDVRLAVALAMGRIGKPAVEPLTKAFDSKDADVRFYVVWGLAFVGADAKIATPTVVKALSDPSAQVRRKAAYALGKIDADPDTVVGAMVGALGDNDADVRDAVAASLPALSKVAVPVLTKALTGDKKELRPLAIKILGQIGPASYPAIPDLKAILIENKTSSEAAAEALAGIGASSVKALTEAADNESQAVRTLAVRALHKIGAPAVPIFVDLLGSKHLDVKREVAGLLGTMQVSDKSVVIALGYATKEKDFFVRVKALQSIQQMGSAAKLAEPYVAALLTDIDHQMRLNAFHTLQAIGADARPMLQKALTHKESSVRIMTASLMAELNFEVDSATPVLVEGLKHKDDALKMQAAYALSIRGLQQKEVLPIFIDGLKHETASVRRQAAGAIARYGRAASNAAPALIAVLDDKDDAVVGAAMATLNIVGGEPKVLFPAMVKVLRRDDTRLHGMAAQVIFQVGPDAVDDIVDLLKKEKAAGLRLACLQTLAMVGPRAKDAVGELTKALDDPSARARMTAARALGNIGPDAKSAKEALEKSEKDEDVHVRQIAKAALLQINADPNRKGFEVQGVVTPGDPTDRVRTGHYHVVHTFYMKKDTAYQIDLRSQWDNYLRLEDPRGKELAQNDDGGGFPNARIIHRAAEDGWHRIIVTTYNQGASGPYTLTVK